MGGGGGPRIDPVNFSRDIEAENTLFGSAERGFDFLTGGGIFDLFKDPLEQLSQALGGQIPASGLPLANVLRESSLAEQSTARRDVEAQLATTGGNRGQTGGNQIIADIITQFSRDRAGIPARVIGETIRQFLPLAQQQTGITAGLRQGALSESAAFNPVSRGRATQAQNLAQAGAPPQQGKSGAGIGALIGTLLPAVFGGLTGGAAPLALSGAQLAQQGPGGFDFASLIQGAR